MFAAVVVCGASATQSRTWVVNQKSPTADDAGDAHLQSGLVSCRSGRHWIIENNSIRWANSVGLDVGREKPVSMPEFGVPFGDMRQLFSIICLPMPPAFGYNSCFGGMQNLSPYN